jgi:hypothetical protein
MRDPELLAEEQRNAGPVWTSHLDERRREYYSSVNRRLTAFALLASFAFVCFACGYIAAKHAAESPGKTIERERTPAQWRKP